MTAEPTVPPTVRGLALVSLFNDVASEMVYPLLPALVTTTLGGGAVTLGALDGAADLTSAALKWLSGRWADRPGWRKPLILTGYATAILTRPLIAVASAAWQVIGFRVVDRVGKGLRTPARDALIAEVTPPAARGRAFGVHRAADHFGAVLGSVAAWLLLALGTDVRGVIGWSALPGIVAFVVLAVVLRAPRARRRDEASELARTGTEACPTNASGHSDDFVGQASAPVRFWPPLLALTALALGRLPEALLLLRVQDLGVPIALIPLLWGGLHVIRSAGSYPGGRLTDRFGPRWMVALGGLLFAAVSAALALRLGPWAAAGVFLLFGGVAGLTEAAERTLVARLDPVRLGRGFGLFHGLTGAAALPAGLLFGALYEGLGGGVALATGAGLMAGATGLWLAATGALQREG